MKHLRKTSHAKYDLKYHTVWVTKYRYPVLTGKIAIRVRDLIRQICSENDVTILAGSLSSKHIHLFVSAPSHLAPSKLIQYCKGATSRKVQLEFPELRKRYWGQHFWARGYYVASSGNVSDEMILQYIHNHEDDDDKQDNFRIAR